MGGNMPYAWAASLHTEVACGVMDFDWVVEAKLLHGSDAMGPPMEKTVTFGAFLQRHNAATVDAAIASISAKVCERYTAFITQLDTIMGETVEAYRIELLQEAARRGMYPPWQNQYR
jgi:hypothetical protein